jgi:hypothetical protein
MIGFPHVAGVLLLIAQPAPDPNTYYATVNACGRDLRNQMDFMTRALATIPDDQPRGFYKQLNRITIDLAAFRELALNKAAKGDLNVAFAPVDRELNSMLTDLQPFSKWDPAVRLAVRRAQSALNDLNLALAADNIKPERRVKLQERQIQTLLNREADLQSMIGVAFLDSPNLTKSWNADLDALRASTTELDRLYKAKASFDAMKKQFVKTGEAWERLVTRFKLMSSQQALILREDFGQVDHVFAGMGALFDIKGQRAPLRWQFAP